MSEHPRLQRELCGGERRGHPHSCCAGSQSTNSFEMMSRSKRKRWTCMFPGTLVLYVTLLCLLPGIAMAQDRAATGEIALFIDENQPPGTVVGTIADESTSSNSYSFLSSPPQEFHLNRTTGIIITTVRIDREALSSDIFQLPVTISDTGGTVNVLELSITVIDLNDNSPVFPQAVQTVSFLENTAIGSSQILPSAMDADKGSNGYVGEYAIESGNEDGVFSLQTFRPRDDAEFTVSLVTNKALDRETLDFFILNISATDNSSSPRTGYFTVNVSIDDMNDNRPIFTQTTYFASINESSPAGTPVLRLEATDLDYGSNGRVLYRLKNGPSDDFSVDPDTGWIFLLRQLPYNEDGYEFEVTATDMGEPLQSNNAFVKVEIEDENDHSPEIIVFNNPEVESSSLVRITETATIGELVFILQALDQDIGDNGAVTLTLDSGNERNDFLANSLNAAGNNFLTLTVSANIDREDVAGYNLTFKAEDGGAPPRITYRSFVVEVVDENDHSPIFLQNSYQASLNESVRIGSYVQSVTAHDADVGVNADIVYSISGDEHAWFQIDSDTGLVTTRAELDHETAAQVILTVTASDQGLEPMSNTTTLTIDILDENDEYPVFGRDMYDGEVPENSLPMDVVQVMATDNDAGVYGNVMFTLGDNQYADKFSIDPISGMVRTLVALDREENDVYEFDVIAYDGGQPPLQSAVRVTIAVLDDNDNTPQFYPQVYYANVKENEDGIFVTTVSATDRDAGTNGAVTYTLVNSSHFQINSATGNITTQVPLDREQQAAYTLIIHAQDGGGQSAPQTATVHVTVIDINDSPLVFEQSPYRFQVEENRVNFTVVGTVRATSLDLNVDITYVIAGGDPSGLFSIDFYSGMIRTTSSIDREAQESDMFQLTVFAVDGAQNGQTTVEIEILDINDNHPVFAVEQDQVDVVENWGVGYEFYATQVTDADKPPNNLILYDLIVNVDNRFGINHTSGVLFINKDLQNYPEKEYNVQIQARDYGNPPLSSTMDLVINVRDVNNNAPMFADSINSTIRLMESTPVNTRFVVATATDADEGTNGEISYQIISGNTGDSFGIFPTGVVYVKRELDREQIDAYDLVIEAVDGGVPYLSSSLDLHIIILDENDNRPIFDNATYNFYLQEEEGIGVVVGIIHAVDNDIRQNGELTYSFTSNHTYFALNSMTGEITSKATLDRESLVAAGQATVFSARVRVHDNGETILQDHSDVNIHIVDINDNAPNFNREIYQASVSELAQNETLIIRVSASDDDIGDNSNVIYSIVGGNVLKKFHIDHESGQIILIGELDREATDHFVLIVKARDGGVFPQETYINVEITVLDENDHVPVFQNAVVEIEVTECLQIGDTVGAVNATDLDINSNGEVSYTITSGNRGSVFGVDTETGTVYLTGLLDHEAISQYHMNITARDGGSPSKSAVASFVVNVRDCNDNTPIFAYVGVPEIDEEKPVGYQVVQMQASDSDSGMNGEIRFLISNQQPGGDLFAIDPESGWVTTNGRIDRESTEMATDQFILTILATDQALPVESRRSALVDVVIFVRDINDNPPTFTSQQAAILSRSASQNSLVTTVHANDPDTGGNGQVTYSLLTTGVPFRLDLTSGELTLTQPLNPSPNLYSLDIRAQDAGSNPEQLSTSFTLTIIISDGQSSGLSFVQSTYTGSIRENLPVGTDIMTVVANYPDGRAASVRYYVAAVSAAGEVKGSLIVVSPTNGIIRSGAVLDREDLGGGSELVATLYAVDTSSSTSQVRSVQVTITVLDQNDNAPIFSDAPYNVSIPENSGTNSLVWTVTATDADLNTVISYSILTGPTQLFSLDSTTGQIRTLGVVNREASPVYQLVIEATDGTQSSTTTVDVHLLDENDNDPTFTESAYSFLVPEDEDVGEDVGVVVATDPDAGVNGEVVYSVVEEDAPGEDVFYLDPNTGAFRLLQPLNFEVKQHYYLTVMATDRGASPRSSVATVYINVVDVNDNDPIFDPIFYSEEVPEDVAIGTSVVTLTASDMDSGVNGELWFSVVSGDPSQRFTVHPNGTVVTIKALDREAESFYNLEIVASDTPSDPALARTSTAQVSIIVTDINDNAPRFTSPDSVEVTESTRTNVVIMVLRAEDDDVERNSYVEYSLLTSNVPFAVSRVEGNLQVAGALDRETVPSYVLLVSATDKGTPSQMTTMNVTVYITDTNDNAPEFDAPPYDATLKEDAPIGLEFLQVSATDPDEGLNSIVQYSIFSGDNRNVFSINVDTGVLSVNSEIDHERQATYTLTVRAQDQGFSTQLSSTTVTIHIDDINDNSPIFDDGSYAPSITENNSPNADIIQVVAQDADSGPNGMVSYRLASDEGGLFTIDASSGLIRVTESLDYETRMEYELVVIAEDAGTPSRQTTLTMTLTVNDDNDHDPVFVSDSYRTTISEDARPGTFVIEVTATDVDSSASLRYQLNNDVGTQFTIDPLDGRIITSGTLDRETQDVYLLTVTVMDGASRQAETSVYVEVLDVNDNPPQFANSVHNALLPSTTTQGRFVAAVQATDIDLGANAAITYSITNGNTAAKFSVDSSTGVVSTAQSLSSETATYNLQITAENIVSGQHVATAALVIDFSTGTFPDITSPSSGTTSSYSENVQTGMTITTVTAIGASTFAIVGGNHGGHFDVGSQSGVVSIIKEFDYETQQSFSLWVQAADGSSPPLTDHVELRISITDVNDNAPVFDQTVYFASVLEEQSGPVEVVSVSASDKDSQSFGEVTYAIESGNINNAFDISSSGAISTVSALDREDTASYVLTVTANDGGNPSQSGSAIVVVTVGDINDNRMSFARIYDATIPENAAPGTHVVTVHTTDPDENNLSQFEIEAGGTSALFAIDRLTGEITLNGSLDYETEPVHDLLIKAFDSQYFVQTQVAIHVEDVNDNAPVFTENFIEVSYPEAIFQEAVLLTTVLATDRDVGVNGEIDYIMKTLSDHFYVTTNFKSGFIYCAKNISYIPPSPGDSSDPNEYVFSVFAVDRGTPALYDEATLIMRVGPDNSHTPVFESPSYTSPVMFNTATNTRIIQVVALDQDTGNNADITYSITGGSGVSKFSIEADTGWIKTSSSLVGDINIIYQLEVKASDQGHFSNEANTTVTLLVTDLNIYPPVFDDQMYRASIAENVVGVVVITVQASDDDDGINGEIRYSLTGVDAELFHIDAVSGVITLTGSLDREASDEHQVTVIAEDRALNSQSSTTTLTVTVTDVDDNPPVFLPREYMADVYENSPSATPVVTVSATDDDEGANAAFEYAIIGGDGRDFFAIDRNSGQILTQGNLDYEVGKSFFHLTVAATNEEATMVDQAHVTVQLLGTNEFYPEFTEHEYDFYVNEHALDGAPVGMVLAFDDDLGDDGNVYYLLIGGSNSQGFAIDPINGQIMVSYANGALDRETADTITLSVLAKNEGPIIGNDVDEAEVIIHILDGNDPPVFSSEQYQAKVLESAGIGSDVTVVTATDYDEEPNFRQFNYSIIGGNDGNAFAIHHSSGRITIANDLDRETVAVYFLTVAATDSGNPPQTGTAIVSVELEDVNDNGPILEGDAAKGSVFENQPSNELVMTLQATDPDANPDPSLFTYALLATPDSVAFRLNGDELFTTQTLDRETKSDYYLEIQASDGETPPVVAVSTIHITITDRNDNPSTARQARIEVKMFQSLFSGGVIGSAKPIDPDTGDNFFCFITNGDTSKFSIQSNCDLFSAAHTTEAQLSIEVSGNDGSHESVTSSFNIAYESFDNDTITNSVTLRLANTDAETFLAESYDRFKGSLAALLGSRETLIALSINDHPDINKADLVIAVKKQGNQHLQRSDLVNLLTQNKAIIESQSDITIETVDYSACSDDPCLNNGICDSETDINLDGTITESNPVILVGIEITHMFSCECPAEFSGETCEIPTDYCEDSACENGATCENTIGDYICLCPPGFSGDLCEDELNECDSIPCRNAATCHDRINSFYCECATGYAGITCEIGPCSAYPCENGGTCSESGSTFICQCDNSHWGNRCQYETIGFEGGSFISRTSLPTSGAVILLEFSTVSTNALLFYNHDRFTDDNAKFVALEILDGNLQLGFNFGAGQSSVSASKVVNDGLWHEVEVRLQGTSVDLNILDEDCPRLETSACRASQDTSVSLDFDSNPLSFGGVQDISDATSRAHQVSAADFVGCMRGIYVNAERLGPDNAQGYSGLVEGCVYGGGCGQGAASCPDGSACMDEWWDTWCDCDPHSVEDICMEAYQPVSFGGSGHVTYQIKEDYKRQALLDEAKNTSDERKKKKRRRRRRAAGTESVDLSFRTGSKHGMLLYIESGSDFTLLELKNGSVVYSFGTSGSTTGEITVIAPSSVTDWEWHSVSLVSTGDQVTLGVDQSQKAALFQDPHGFTSLALTGMSLGGGDTPVTVDGRTLEGFSGCLDGFEMNGDPLPLNGHTARFEAVPSTSTGAGCTPASLCATMPCGVGEVCLPSETSYTCVPAVCSPDICQNGGTCLEGSTGVTCKCPAGYSGDYCGTGSNPYEGDGPNIVVIVVPVIVILLLIAVVLAVVYFARRRSVNLKSKQAGQGRSLQDPTKGSVLGSAENAAFMGDTMDEATMLGPDGKVNVSGLMQRQTPDIIEQNMGHQDHSNPSSNSLMMENDTGEHVNQMEMQNMQVMDGAELYDLENASSIAASSDVDIAYHYKHYHDQGRNRRKKKHRSNQNPMLARIQASPARLSPVGMGSELGSELGSDLAHSTPLDSQNPMLRQSPGLHSNYSTNNTLRIGSLPNSGRATPARNIASPVHSDRSYQSELRSQAHRSDVSSLRSGGRPSRVNTPLSHDIKGGKPSTKGGRTSKSPHVGLTAEEVAQLNTARPDLMSGSQASTIDDLSSECSHGDHHHTPVDPSHLLEPPDSTSDDTNGSFTCSEREYEKSSPMRGGRDDDDDFNSTKSAFLTRLAEIEHAHDSMLPHVNGALKQKRLDSNGGSLSTLFTSEDENGHALLKKEKAKGDASLERLLGWGPKFDNLMGVFKDIAHLHENNGKITLETTLTPEEFV